MLQYGNLLLISKIAKYLVEFRLGMQNAKDNFLVLSAIKSISLFELSKNDYTRYTLKLNTEYTTKKKCVARKWNVIT